jgi:outer membrane protein assembly factor BamB
LSPGIRTISLIALATLWMAAASAGAQVSDPRYWAQWRGPEATGVSRTATPPVEWSETENIRWKIEIPGRGSGTPVIWGDRVFLMTAVPVGVDMAESHLPRGGQRNRGVHRFVVMAIARDDGRVLWERTVREEEPHEGAHVDNGTWASSSVVTDGDGVYAYFESRGLYAFDLEGNPRWEVDFGDKAMRNQFGEGSTPALWGDRLVVVWDHIGGQSFVASLDKATGEEIWRVNRDEIDTWATPLVVEVNGEAQVVVPGRDRLISYALDDGEIVWQSDGLTMNPIPSPVHAGGIMIAMAGYQGNDLKAVRLADARGDITGTEAILWELGRDTPYVPSPLLYDGVVYFLKSNSGILTALEAETGRPLYALQRLEGVPNVFASPVAADGRVYLAGRDGATQVIRHGPTYEVLATNVLDDGFDASPALVDGEIYLRGYRYLYSIAED